MKLKGNDRQAVKRWEAHLRNLLRALSVDHTESEADKLIRRRRLEADPEAWFAYYFPAFATHEPAPFHRRSTKRLVKNARWFVVRAWSRELAKSTRTMMEVLYFALVTQETKNVLMVSNSVDNAVRLLAPYRLNLEENRRIIHDYGAQKRVGSWTDEEFITLGGVSFRALGAGQSPRGTKHEQYRVDTILIDDIDTDEECRNEKRIKDKFKWIEKALIPTLSVSGKYRIIVCGNIIAKVCTVKLLMDRADDVEIINIRDKHGKSVWAKNSEEDIDRFLGMMSYTARQGEFFNNPIVEGSVFTRMTYGPVRPLREYGHLVCYTDPSFRDSKKNDYKATVLVGEWNGEIHVIKAFVDQTTTRRMVDWHLAMMDYVADRVPVYFYMEANFLQDVILSEFQKVAAEQGRIIPIKPDKRKKLDKFTRIESLLEPLNATGRLFLNEREKDDPHMKVLEEQFLALEPGSAAHDDGPDAVEGAAFILAAKKQSLTANTLDIQRVRRTNSKRY